MAIARNLFDGDALAEAVTVLTGILELQQVNSKHRATAYGMRGEPHFLLKKLELAYSDFADAIELQAKVTNGEPYLHRLHYHRGLAANRTARYKEAIADFKACLSLQSNDSKAANSLSWLLATSPMTHFMMAFWPCIPRRGHPGSDD